MSKIHLNGNLLEWLEKSVLEQAIDWSTLEDALQQHPRLIEPAKDFFNGLEIQRSWEDDVDEEVEFIMIELLKLNVNISGENTIFYTFSTPHENEEPQVHREPHDTEE